MNYTTTDGDGLQLTAGYFKGTKVFARVTLPFIKVNYAETEGCCTDNLQDAVRRAGPSVQDQIGGFQIYSVYCFGQCLPSNGQDAFAYKYIERYFFYAAGLFVARLDIYGPSLYPSAT